MWPQPICEHSIIQSILPQPKEPQKWFKPPRSEVWITNKPVFTHFTTKYEIQNMRVLYYFQFYFVSTFSKYEVCRPNPCANNGTCWSTDIMPVCNCVTGFTGFYCRSGFSWNIPNKLESIIKSFWLDRLIYVRKLLAWTGANAESSEVASDVTVLMDGLVNIARAESKIESMRIPL